MYEDGLDMSIQAERQLPQIPKIAHIGARKPLPQYEPRPDELGNYIVGAERTLPADKSGCKNLWLLTVGRFSKIDFCCPDINLDLLE